MDNALRQYIELYRDNRSEIDSASAPVLNARRPDACRMLELTSLPKPGSEDYEVTDLPAILSPDYGVNIRRVQLPVNPAESFRCGIPRMTPALFFMVNDRFGTIRDSYSALPEGIEVTGLAEAARRMPEVVEKYYGRLADMENPLVALSDLLSQDGLWIRVRAGVKVKTPVQIVNILGGAEKMLAPRRVLIVMEEDSEVSILSCDHTAGESDGCLALQTVEIFAGERSCLHYYDMEESAASTSRLATLWLRQEAESDVTVGGMTIYNGRTRNEYHTVFAAPDSRLSLVGMGIADDDRVIDVFSKVCHDSPRCNTDELFKFSVDGRARCGFGGMIRVAEGAEKTEAYQSNRNLVGSDEARMHSRPQLEIYNDDVKCSHGSATGQLDQMQLFYMRTRGLSEAQARLLLKQAFMADVIEKVGIPGLSERLTHIVERRFAGEGAGCHNCASECPSHL
ncbi:MAG: Fe-S cluster assembly protein SufD [Bacteroides sp.]|nr:Fe-S cluster assembly protein SufD [Bacteroides sp.]